MAKRKLRKLYSKTIDSTAEEQAVEYVTVWIDAMLAGRTADLDTLEEDTSEAFVRAVRENLGIIRDELAKLVGCDPTYT